MDFTYNTDISSYLNTFIVGGSKKMKKECNRELQMTARRNQGLSRISKHLENRANFRQKKLKTNNKEIIFFAQNHTFWLTEA